MNRVLISKPIRSLMQSNLVDSNDCFIIFLDLQKDIFSEDIMEWNSFSHGTVKYLLRFSSLDSAIEYCHIKNLDYKVVFEPKNIVEKQSYEYNLVKNRNLYYF